MRPIAVPVPVLAVALQACTAEPELLNSERIETTFGSYGIEVLQNDPTLRRSNLYSVQDGVRTCRTYAVVRFLEQPDARTRDEHSKIVSGGSIGEVFKSHGWRIFKQTLHVGDAQLQHGDTAIAPMMRLDGERSLAMHVYRLLIEKDDASLDYATIVEVHHPDYLNVSDLKRLYPVSEEAILSADQLAALVSLVTERENH